MGGIDIDTIWNFPSPPQRLFHRFLPHSGNPDLARGTTRGTTKTEWPWEADFNHAATWLSPVVCWCWFVSGAFLKPLLPLTHPLLEKFPVHRKLSGGGGLVRGFDLTQHVFLQIGFSSQPRLPVAKWQFPGERCRPIKSPF